MRKLSKQIAGVLAAAMILSCSGCEKKAAVVEGNTMVETEVSDNTEDTSAETAKEKDTSEEKKKDSPWWSEHIDGNGQGFDYVDIKGAEFLEIDPDTLLASTVEMVEFDKDYIHKLCDMVFDGGQVEVYDFDNKTKRVYDDLITQYENLLEIYDSYKANDDSALDSYPFKLFPYGGWELRPNTEEFERSVIEEDLNRIKAEREDAPETIENNYSYGGYIGKIDGEEYYMFLGNRKYDEYLSAPDTFQRNGRVITIMKADMEGAFRGETHTDGEGVSERPDEKKNAIATDYLMTGLHTDIIPDENYMLEAERFLTKIGYGSYVNNNYETMDLLWGNSVTNGFLNVNDYHMSVNNYDTSDGQCLYYEMSSYIGAFPSSELLDTAEYSETDLLDADSYIKVMVNDSGIVGCQIYNPIRILKTDEISNLIDKEDAKDIVRESINDKDLWNHPINQKVNCFELNEVRLISFPIKSDVKDNEYTYVPCYMFWNVSSEYSSPFMLINAIDGSIVKIEDNLAGYPAGWLKSE